MVHGDLCSGGKKWEAAHCLARSVECRLVMGGGTWQRGRRETLKGVIRFPAAPGSRLPPQPATSLHTKRLSQIRRRPPRWQWHWAAGCTGHFFLCESSARTCGTSTVGISGDGDGGFFSHSASVDNRDTARLLACIHLVASSQRTGRRPGTAVHTVPGCTMGGGAPHSGKTIRHVANGPR